MTPTIWTEYIPDAMIPIIETQTWDSSTDIWDNTSDYWDAEHPEGYQVVWTVVNS